MADPRSNRGGGPPPPPAYLQGQQDDPAAAAEAVAAAQLLTTAAAGVAGVAGYAVPGVIGGMPGPGELESMDLNMLREWLDESFSDNDADVSSSDGGGGSSESLMQLLYQNQQLQQGMAGGHSQHQQFTGFGFGDESEMKIPASMSMPPTGRNSGGGGGGSKRQQKRQRAAANSSSNSAAQATIDVSVSDDEDEHGKKKTWPNQREELVYLRTKVCTLENELREIKIASRKQFSKSAAMLARFTSTDGTGMVACSTPGSLWEQVANRQLDEKVRAEVENRKLRGMVESQIRLAKKLQQLLRKRQIWEGLMEQKPKNEADMKPEESKIYAFLAQKIEDRFPHIDAFFDHHGLTNAMNEAREINVKFDDQAPAPGPGGGGADGGAGTGGGPGGAPGGNMYIEMKECKIMPFDFRAADAAVWRCLKAEIYTMHNTSATVIDTDENVLRAKVAVKLAGRGSEVELTVWSLWRRYMEHDRAIYAVESLAITSGTSVPGSPIIQIKQSATAIVRPFTLTSAPVASIVRVYVRSTPSIIQDAAQEAASRVAGHPQVGVLTDMLIGSYHQNVEAMYKAVENLLLDELLKGKMRG